METRKLQRVGGGTFTVSIPKSWANERGFEAGTAVNLYTHHDGSIVVRSHEMDHGALESIDVSVDGPTDVSQVLRAAQTAGFVDVRLSAPEGFSSETLRELRSLVRGFIGTELVETQEGSVVVRNLLESADVSVRQTIHQLLFVALSVLHRSVSALTVTDPDSDQLNERAAEADRLCEMVARQFSRALVSFEELDTLGISRPALFDCYETAQHLSAVADEAATIARTAERASMPLSPDVSESLTDVTEDVRTAVEQAAVAVLEQGTAGEARTASRRCAETRTALCEMDERLVQGASERPESVGDAVAVARTLDALGRVLDHGESVADVAFRALARERQLSLREERV